MTLKEQIASVQEFIDDTKDVLTDDAFRLGAPMAYAETQSNLRDAERQLAKLTEPITADMMIEAHLAGQQAGKEQSAIGAHFDGAIPACKRAGHFDRGILETLFINGFMETIGESVTTDKDGTVIVPSIPEARVIRQQSTPFYDYTHNAWIIDGKYQTCGHPASMHCTCYGKIHAGEPIAPDSEVH